jgi:hypothetical protein
MDTGRVAPGPAFLGRARPDPRHLAPGRPTPRGVGRFCAFFCYSGMKAYAGSPAAARASWRTAARRSM